MEKLKQIAKMHEIISRNPCGEWGQAQDLYEAGFFNVDDFIDKLLGELDCKINSKGLISIESIEAIIKEVRNDDNAI